MAQQVKKITVVDVLIVTAIVITAIVSSFLLSADTGRRIAVIEIDGIEYARYDLDSVSPFEEEIKTKRGYNTIQVSNAGVRVISADCKNKTDVKRGIISRGGESIICLPHRLVIYIEGEEAALDSISY